MKDNIKSAIYYALLAVSLVALSTVVMFRWSYAAGEREYPLPQEEIAAPAPSPSPTPAATPSPSPTPENKTGLTLAVGGDLVIHSGINAEAETDGGYNYTALLSDAAPIIQAADYAVCTLETTLDDGGEYSGYPAFITPVELASSLAETGFDLLNTATEQCNDNGLIGISDTINFIEGAGLETVGTFRSRVEKEETCGVKTVEINGIRLGFVSFTYGTENYSDAYTYAISLYKKDSEIDFDVLDASLNAAKALDCDITVVMMHWGNEYYTEPTAEQMELADYLFAGGADIIIGGHALVPQPMEKRTVTDANGFERECYLIYCTGSLLSCLDDQYTNLSSILTFSIEKDHNTGISVITALEAAPMLQLDLSKYAEAGDWRYRVLDINATMEAWKNGDDRGFMTEGIYAALQTALDDWTGIAALTTVEDN